MEKSPSERKPNRALRGKYIRAAIAEALAISKDFVTRPSPPPYVAHEEIGIGAMDIGQPIVQPPDEPEHWDNWPRS